MLTLPRPHLSGHRSPTSLSKSPADLLSWLDHLRAEVSELAAMGLDATAKKRRRTFSRAESRRRTKEAQEAILAQLCELETWIFESVEPSPVEARH